MIDQGLRRLATFETESKQVHMCIAHHQWASRPRARDLRAAGPPRPHRPPPRSRHPPPGWAVATGDTFRHGKQSEFPGPSDNTNVTSPLVFNALNCSPPSIPLPGLIAFCPASLCPPTITHFFSICNRKNVYKKNTISLLQFRSFRSFCLPKGFWSYIYDTASVGHHKCHRQGLQLTTQPQQVRQFCFIVCFHMFPIDATATIWEVWVPGPARPRRS